MRKQKKNLPENCRLYTFINMYLSSIQQGIQSLHVAVDMANLYNNEDTPAANLYQLWSHRDKTVIVCNGGMSKDIFEAYDHLSQINDGDSYPIEYFDEEMASFNAIVTTGFGIVLPEHVWGAKPVWTKPSRGPARKTGDWEYGVVGVNHVVWKDGSEEAEILKYITSRPLAR